MALNLYQLRTLINSDDVFASSLLSLLVAALPPHEIENRFNDFLQLEPRSHSLIMQQAYGVQLNDKAAAKLLAAIGIVTTNFFYSSLPHFNSYTNALAGKGLDVTVYEPADPADMAWAVVEAALLYPPEDPTDDDFSIDIQHYVGHILDAEGITENPDALAFAIRPKGVDQLEIVDSDTSTGAFVLSREISQVEEINKWVDDELSRYELQLKSLPIKNIDPEFSIKNMLAKVQQ